MWLANIKIKHDCVIGNRCKKFGITTTGTPFNVYVKKGITHSPQVQVLHGSEEKIKEFLEDLKKDKRITNFEIKGNVVFFIEVRKEVIPATYYNQKLFHVKPVFVDKEGFEYWEVASWTREIITNFISKLKKHLKDVILQKIGQTKLTDIYFSSLMPKLTEHQKMALELAYENGFYCWPKKTDFGKLAKLMRVSVPTYREHLKRAEEKIMPDLIKKIQ